MDIANLWGGYQSDEDKSLKVTASNLAFGLNQNVVLKKFEYSTLTGSGGSEGNPAIIVEFSINGTDKNTRIYDPTVPGGKVFYRGKQVMDTNSPDYAAGLGDAVKLAKALITHYIKASGKSEEQIQVAFSAGVTSFADLARIASTILADVIVTKKPLDLMLQYQSKISGSADQTYLDIPGNLAYGSFVTPHETPSDEWREENKWIEKDEAGNDISKSGLRYVDGSGKVHRFERDETFMKSKVATIQHKGNAMASGSPVPSTAGTANPQKATWD